MIFSCGSSRYKTAQLDIKLMICLQLGQPCHPNSVADSTEVELRSFDSGVPLVIPKGYIILVNDAGSSRFTIRLMWIVP